MAESQSQSAPVSFGNFQESGDQELGGASPLAINVLADGKGVVRRRPGITQTGGLLVAAPFAGPVLGVAIFENELYFVAANRGVYKHTGFFGSTYMGMLLGGTERPTFAVTQFRLVIAGGGSPLQVTSGALVATLLGGSPPPASQVVALASRLFMNDLTDASTAGRIRFSRTGNAGEEVWDPLDFVSTEARPDDLVALRENANELFAFGTSTLQSFSPDPTTILAPGRAMNRGIAAGASIIAKNDTFAWMDEQKQMVVSDGRSVQVVSDAIAGTLDGIDTVSDAVGFWLNMDQFSVLCWNFPTDGRAFALQERGGWSQFQGWSRAIPGYIAMPIAAHCYWPERDLHVVGLTSGAIMTLDAGEFTDNGDIIKAEVRTGFLNRGTDAPKSCDMIRLTFKRGVDAGGTTEPIALLSWRDDTGAFCTPVSIGLGTIPDRIFTVELRGLGVYVARQWKLEYTDNTELILARAEEVFTPGGNN